MHTSIAYASRARCSIPDLTGSRSFFVCRDCLARRNPIRTPVVRRCGYATKKQPLTERIRQRIWGGDAPGPKNVYGEPKLFTNRKAENDLESEDVDGVEELEPRDTYARVREAYSSEQAKEEDSTYEAAETWDELPKIGGKGAWWEREWDEENIFAPFRSLKPKQSTLKKQLFDVISGAYVEASILQAEDPTISDICQLPQSTYIPFKEAQITIIDGKPSLSSFPPEWHSKINELIQTKKNSSSAEAETQTTDVESEPIDTIAVIKENSSSQNEPSVESHRQHWMELSLKSLPLRFAVVKRVSQLTGTRLNDAAINNMENLGQLFKEIQTRDKPKTAHEALSTQVKLATLPNVHIYDKRQTWVDKEKHLGRYKVIVNELEKSNLPVPRTRRRNNAK